MAYIDGELPLDSAADTAAHLQECRECQILAAEIKNVSDGLAAWEIPAVEPAINDEVSKALEDREEQQGSASGRRTWFGGNRFGRAVPWAGAAVAGGVAVFLLTFALIATMSRGEHKSMGVASRVQPGAQQSMALSMRNTAPTSGGDRDRLMTYSADLSASQRQELLKRQQAAELASNLEVDHAAQVQGQSVAEPDLGPMIIRTAQLTVTIQNLDEARAQVDKIVQRYGGYVGDLTTSASSDGPRKLTATLRVPAAQLDGALAELKKLGHVESETQNGQDVTAQYVDLEGRLSNSRNTEKRLLELLSNRTGKLSDVLEVETEISRVREEIERMEGERRLMAKQAAYATLTATVTEEYKAPARALPDSLGTRFRNAAVDGYQSVVNFIVDVALFLVSDGPMLLLWIAILFFPARWAWRKLRRYRETPSL